MDKRDSLDRSSNELAQTSNSVKPSAADGGGGSLLGGESPKGQQFPDVAKDPSPVVNSVLQSDVRHLKIPLARREAHTVNQIGINTLLTRLKQSIASARVCADTVTPDKLRLTLL